MDMAATEGEQIQFSGHTLDKAIKAKVHLENYYSNLIAQHIERKSRHEKLEETMKEEGLTEEQKQEKEKPTCIKRDRIFKTKTFKIRC
ncbi:hypothetical protein CEXT_59681 [Caerostris extrusa]|uniref:Uncharacterized protein n=1 Tax=Caerostris extrusa TaxID=172846 RepID=A0AAV4Q8Z5_CAEEX|nr:hypothetical protein CEXT_59681 [Caerostris extrusa]